MTLDLILRILAIVLEIGRLWVRQNHEQKQPDAPKKAERS